MYGHWWDCKVLTETHFGSYRIEEIHISKIFSSFNGSVLKVMVPSSILFNNMKIVIHVDRRLVFIFNSSYKLAELYYTTLKLIRFAIFASLHSLDNHGNSNLRDWLLLFKASSIHVWNKESWWPFVASHLYKILILT